jgi:hypothetical protein
MNKKILNRDKIASICLSCFMLMTSLSLAQTKDGLVDLGLGIPQEKEKSTASIFIVTAKELQETAAITLQMLFTAGY